MAVFFEWGRVDALEEKVTRSLLAMEDGNEKRALLLANALEDLARHLESKDLTISQEQFKTRIEALSIQAAELEKKFF